MLIKNVRIVNHNQEISNADIEIEGKLIKNIIVKPGNGKHTIIPGFIDTHVHGSGGHDVMDSKAAIKLVSKQLVKFGITSFVPTIMTASKPKLIMSLENFNDLKVDGSKICGIHSEGPFISLEKKGAHDPKYLLKDDHTFLKEMQKAAKGQLRKITYAPEIDNLNFIKLMKDLNIIINIGHSNATYHEALIAIDNGATSVCHLWNAMTGVENRNPGLAQVVLPDKRIYKELIADLVHVDAETIKFSIDVAGSDRIMIVSDAIRPAGLDDGNYTSGGLKITKKGPKITLFETDTIAGGGGSIYTGFINLLKMKYSLMDIVKMTSYNAAKNMGLSDIGVIEKNMKADLILFDNNYNIIDVYVDGVKK